MHIKNVLDNWRKKVNQLHSVRNINLSAHRLLLLAVVKLTWCAPRVNNITIVRKHHVDIQEEALYSVAVLRRKICLHTSGIYYISPAEARLLNPCTVAFHLLVPTIRDSWRLQDFATSRKFPTLISIVTWNTSCCYWLESKSFLCYTQTFLSV